MQKYENNSDLQRLTHLYSTVFTFFFSQNKQKKPFENQTFKRKTQKNTIFSFKKFAEIKKRYTFATAMMK